jgi:hypothetical protein
MQIDNEIVNLDELYEKHTSQEPDKRGQPDRAYKLWGQVVRALGMEKDSIGEVVNAISQYPLSTYVTESFKTPEGGRVARDKEQRATYRKAGFQPRNYVDSVSKA